MPVRGLPRQIIRNGCAASRVLAAKTPNIEAERKTRRGSALAADDSGRPDRRAGGPSCGRTPFNALPMGEIARAALPPAEALPTAEVAAGPHRDGRSRPRRQ